MGKNAGYHLMYSHGSTLGGCGTASPNGFDIATAYRAGKANSQKVLYIGMSLIIRVCMFHAQWAHYRL